MQPLAIAEPQDPSVEPSIKPSTEKLESQIQYLTSQIAYLKTELAQSNIESEQRLRALDKLREDAEEQASAMQQNAIQNYEHNALIQQKSEIIQDQAAQIKDLQQKMQLLDSSASKLADNTKQFEKQIAQLIAENGELKTDLIECKQRILKGELAQTASQNLNIELRQTNQHLEQQLKQSKTDISDLGQKLTKAEEQTTTSLKSKDQLISSTQQQIQEQSALAQQLQQFVDELTESNNEMQEKYQNELAQRQELQTGFDFVQSKLAETKKQLIQALDEVSLKQQQIAELNQKLRDQTVKNELIQRMREQLSQVQDGYTAQLKENELLRRQMGCNAQLITGFKQLGSVDTQQLQNLKSELERYKSLVKRLGKQLQSEAMMSSQITLSSITNVSQCRKEADVTVHSFVRQVLFDDYVNPTQKELVNRCKQAVAECTAESFQLFVLILQAMYGDQSWVGERSLSQSVVEMIKKAVTSGGEGIRQSWTK